jgi:hypothetical protein
MALFHGHDPNIINDTLLIMLSKGKKKVGAEGVVS